MTLLSADSFNRLDQNLVGTLTDGAGTLDPLTWAKNSSGDCYIESNHVRINSAGITLPVSGTTHSAINYVDLATPDAFCTILAPSGSGSAWTIGVVIRFTDVNNFILLRSKSTVTIGYDLYVVQAGVTTILGTDNSSVIIASKVFGLRAYGDTIEVWSDGSLRATYFSTFNKTATKHGVFIDYASFAGGPTFDNWSAQSVPSPVPTVTSIGATSGSTLGGETVVILGHDFTGATAVKFGATNATSFTVVNFNRIQAVAPPHAAGLVDITVVTPLGTSTTSSADQYTFILARPFVASVTPTSGLTAGGTSVAIVGMNFLGTTAITFGGIPATSFTVVDDTHITAVAPAHVAGTVTVVVTTPAGSSA